MLTLSEAAATPHPVISVRLSVVYDIDRQVWRVEGRDVGDYIVVAVAGPSAHDTLGEAAVKIDKYVAKRLG